MVLKKSWEVLTTSNKKYFHSVLFVIFFSPLTLRPQPFHRCTRQNIMFVVSCSHSYSLRLIPGFPPTTILPKVNTLFNLMYREGGLERDKTMLSFCHLVILWWFHRVICRVGWYVTWRYWNTLQYVLYVLNYMYRYLAVYWAVLWWYIQFLLSSFHDKVKCQTCQLTTISDKFRVILLTLLRLYNRHCTILHGSCWIFCVLHWPANGRTEETHCNSSKTVILPGHCNSNCLICLYSLAICEIFV